MPRLLFDESRVHPAVRDKLAGYQADLIREVQDAIAANAVVVVGMRQNPFPKHARRILDNDRIPYKYLEYGSYFSQWRRRLALKMWTGWPTLPMIWVKGSFIGGGDDLARLHHSGELKKMLA